MAEKQMDTPNKTTKALIMEEIIKLNNQKNKIQKPI